MENRSFCLFEKKILIYGAGDKGWRVLKVLRGNGSDAIMFIDKRAKSYDKYHGLNVMSPDDLNSLKNKNDYAIIITVKNAYAHNEIAVCLAEKGFFNLIFMPLYVLKGGNDNIVLNTVMQANIRLTDKGEFVDEPCPAISCTDLHRLPNKSIIAQFDDKIKLYLPVEYFFISGEGAVLNRSVVFSSFVTKMFEEFGGMFPQKACIGLNAYLNDAAMVAETNGVPVDDEWRANFIAQKLSVYENMRKQLMLNPAFFKNNCSEVEYKGLGKFEIVGTGKNRVSFLAAQQYRYIPAIINKSDYMAFSDITILNNIKGYIKSNKLKFPISHPEFFEYDSDFDNYVWQWLVPVIRKIQDNLSDNGRGIAETSCVDMCCDYGNMYRLLSSLGANVKRTDKSKLAIMLDKLWGFKTNIADVDSIKAADTILVSEGSADELYSLIKSSKTRVSQIFLKCPAANNKLVDLFANAGFGFEKIFEAFVNGEAVCGYYFKKY